MTDQSQSSVDEVDSERPSGDKLASGTYEVLRNRLVQQADDLRARLEDLNGVRKEIFGSIDTELVATARITTDHNCLPRDLFTIGDRVLLGYNVKLGLKTETTPEDVFAVFTFQDHQFLPEDLSFIGDERFQLDFKELYRYYRKTTFVKFSVLGPYLYLVFRVGDSITDVKTFKWTIVDDRLEYNDNRSDHEFRFPPQHEFEWTRTHRDLHRSGAHPHVSIENRVFVETVGGDLTIKVEDNTEDGEGIYSEVVENADQTLDDADIFYAIVGNNILLKIRPYQENSYRYLVYNEKVQEVQRIDAIGSACVFLPDDHGLIFANGYYLDTGELKVFDTDSHEMLFERRIAAPNGEDHLYVFYNRRSGTYVLLSYNLIDQEVRPPILCNGFSLLPNGELVYFKEHGEPQKHHTAQIWQTPFVAEELPEMEASDSFLFKVGNRELVRCMAECHELLGLTRRDEGYANLYLDLVKKAGDILDSYFWITDPEAFSLAEPLGGIRSAASSAVDEFDKVTEIRRRTAKQTAAVEAAVVKVERETQSHRYQSLEEFVASLAELRQLRGEVIALKDLRYVDEGEVEQLDQRVADRSGKLAENCVTFLLQPHSLDPYRAAVAEAEEAVPSVETVSVARKLEGDVDGHAEGLELLVETVSGLEIADATQRTEIVDAISEIFAHVNQVRAALKRKTKELLIVEGAAEFGSQIRLLGQAVVSSLDLCDSPQRCDEQLTKLMVQIEELEARFAEFDEFVDQIGEKRQEIYDAFESRKLQLVERRNRRAEGLQRTADRILQGVETRLESFSALAEIHAYFAADPMVAKVRTVVEELLELDDSVKADEIQSRLKSIRESAARQLKDRQELFVDGENVIRFGERTFSVNVQPLDLTTVVRDGELYLHLTGSNYFERIEDAELATTRSVWQQELISEDASVYRSEYLAYRFVSEFGDLHRLRTLDEEAFLAEVQRFAAPRYREGYVKGVHDRDAAKIARELVHGIARAGVLKYPSEARALAWIAWTLLFDAEQRETFEARLRGLGTIRTALGEADASGRNEVVERLASELDAVAATPNGVLTGSAAWDEWIPEAAEFLRELFGGAGEFGIGPEAAELFRELRQKLERTQSGKQAQRALEELRDRPVLAFLHARDWVEAFVMTRAASQVVEGTDEEATAVSKGVVDEVALALVEGLDPRKGVLPGETALEIEGLLGDHPVLDGGDYRGDVPSFLHRVGRFVREVCPRFELYQQKKRRYLEEERERIRLEEFRPRVLTSFVRNRLIDRHYLPMIGDNLAKQIGVAGANKRTDLMGLLLLVSPPGYGKTTLMEYVASRLGLTFVKINGPAIGHRVTSLDPNEAPNAGAREEVEKLNFALELGDNVMIYLDDIQHTNSEFLQKFISLCDGQRRIEGVFRGRTRTYDLRGRKVAVVMAGNPYTESGEKFQIPDMLANRADTYNLGDLIGDNQSDFELSYIENCLSSNAVLDKLASKSQKDLYGMLAIAETGERAGVEFESDYSAPEVEEIVGVLRKLLRIRDVILKVNSQYIASAAQADDYRTEPPFQLQGSYRNMAKLAEKVLPVMNDEELETLIYSHYESESQTLTSGAEANFLKLKELLGSLSDDEAQRWASIKETFARNNKLRGFGGDDRAGQVVLQLTELGESLGSIRNVLASGLERRGEEASLPSADFAQALADALGSVTRAERPDIRVVNKVPQSFLQVIRQQFAVMQSWMLPLIELLRESGGSDELRRQFDGARESYESLIDQLERSDVEDEDGAGSETSGD